ncbi:MAG: proton-conducting membrane transporter [Clostridia bacterium]|nr:proton-conducting membrane transporter [Clostridia bacterium]
MNSLFLLIPVLFPIIAGLLSYLMRIKSEKLRRVYFTAVIFATSVFVWLTIFYCTDEPVTLLQFTDSLALTLRLDGAGKIFAGLSSALWPLTAIYAFDYMGHEKHKGMFWCFFTVSYGVTMGIAMSANLLTMYLFYEMLTLATLPLVIHGMDRKAFHAGKKYMIYSFGGAAFAFTALAYLISIGLEDFTYGGFLAGRNINTDITLVLFAIGFIGFSVKAAIVPFHGWLPTAGIAPTPVTALLHSVAVVKAGAFAVIRLTYYTFGTELLNDTPAQHLVMIVAIVTIVYGSAKALRQNHFKRRMAYSTVANLSYILFAAALMSESGLAASLFHMVAHSFIKIVAFFAAGAVLHYTGCQHIDELEGMGRKMPLTFAAFTVSALALTGIPPLNGFFSKWYILTAAGERGCYFALAGMAALIISAFLTAVYMFSIVIKAYFPRKNRTCDENIKEASPLMTCPMILISLCSVAMGIFSNELYDIIVKAVFG